MIQISLFTPVLSSPGVPDTLSTGENIIGKYEALCRQSSCEFDWWILDNTSSDHIRPLAECWTEENRITLHYHHLPDTEIISCFNFAVRNIKAPLCGYLPDQFFPDDNFIDDVLDKWEMVRINPRIAGIISKGITISRTSILKRIFPVSAKQIRTGGIDLFPIHNFLQTISHIRLSPAENDYLWNLT